MVERFLNYLLVEKQYSKLTVRAYKDDICQFLLYMGFSIEALGEFNPDAVTSVDIRNYIMTLSEQHLKHTSINRKISSLKSLFRYGKKMRLVHKDPTAAIHQLKKERKIATFVPESVMNKAMDSMSYNGEDYIQERRDLILLLLYGTGIRLAELIGIKVSDIDFNRSEVRVLGKGNKQRIVPLAALVVTKIKNYLKIRENILQIENNLLFLSLKNESISRSEVYRIVHSQLTEMGMSGKRSPHVLRHTFATHLLNSGAGIETVKDLLGHANLSATQIYTHNNIGILLDKYKKAHPRANINIVDNIKNCEED